MPNGTYAPGSPVVNAIKGFDRPNELYCVVNADNTPIYFGYRAMCEFYVEAGHADKEIKPMNPETGLPFDYINT